MPEPILTLHEAGRARAAAAVKRSARPSRRRSVGWLNGIEAEFRSPDRAAAAASGPMNARLQIVRAAGATDPAPVLRGYATTYGEPYEMYDMFGAYTEVVEAGAGEATLKASPDVKFLFNHAGMPMARTLGSETLDLSEDDHGLLSVATPNMDLTISREVVSGVDRGDLDEMSFAFVIIRGMWSPDWTQYTIKEYDLHRGDTSSVTYGANPHTELDVERSVDDTQGDRRTLSAEARQRARRILAGHIAS